MCVHFQTLREHLSGRLEHQLSSSRLFPDDPCTQSGSASCHHTWELRSRATILKAENDELVFQLQDPWKPTAAGIVPEDLYVYHFNIGNDSGSSFDGVSCCSIARISWKAESREIASNVRKENKQLLPHKCFAQATSCVGLVHTCTSPEECVCHLHASLRLRAILEHKKPEACYKRAAEMQPPNGT
eukprot:5032997-Amphidinium_carterae.1